jgi:hypothetical protein
MIIEIQRINKDLEILASCYLSKPVISLLVLKFGVLYQNFPTFLFSVYFML